MKNASILFALFLHSFLIFTAFTRQVPRAFAAATNRSTASVVGRIQTLIHKHCRIDSLNPLYVTTYGPCFLVINCDKCRSEAMDWSGADRMVALNYARGRRIIWVAFVNPHWVAGKNFADWLRAYTNYTRAVALRYGDKLWAMQVGTNPPHATP